MRLSRIQLHNFRSLRDAEFFTPPYTLVVGANNAGKSTIVDAIRAFYEHEKFRFRAERDFPKGIELEDEQSWAELDFALDATEFESLTEKYQHADQTLRVRKWFSGAPEGRANGTIYGRETSGELSEDSIFGASNVQRGRLGKIIYIPAVSRVDEHTKLTGPSALRDTIDELLGAVVADSPAYAAFRIQFDEFCNSVRETSTPDGRSIQDFERALSDQLSSWEAGFRLRFAPPAAQDITKNLIDWDLTDAEGNRSGQSVDQFGSGFQRHFIASLIRTRASFLPATQPSTRKQFAPTLTLILFEEPEAYLHPPQQVSLANNLRTVVGQEHWQVLASTHSPHFVSRNTNDLNGIVRVRRDRGASTVHQLSLEDQVQIFSAREELERILGHWDGMNDEQRAELERIRYFIWLDNERCTIFFCDLVLLVEGQTESALFARLIDDGKLRLSSSCGILQSEGKYNTVRFMRLLNALGLPFVVIHDLDGDKSQNEALNQLIRDESDANEYCRGLIVIEPHLERYLGWIEPDRKRAGLKPGVALWNYEQAIMDTPNLDELCERICNAAQSARL